MGIRAVFEGLRALLMVWNRKRAETRACFVSFRFWSPDKNFWLKCQGGGGERRDSDDVEVPWL